MKQNEVVVESSFALLLRVLRVFGITPMQLEPYGSMYILRKSRMYILWSWALSSVFAAVSTAACCLDFMNFKSARAVFTVNLSSCTLIFIKMVSTMGITMAAAISSGKRMDRFIQYFNCLKKINTTNFSRQIISKGQNWKLVALMLCTLITCTGLIIWEYYNAIDHALKYKKPVIIVYLYYFLIFGHNFILILEYPIMMVNTSICEALKNVNSDIEDFIAGIKPMNKEVLFQSTSSYVILHKKFFALIDSYVYICNLIRQVNKNEGLMMIVLLFFTVNSLVLNIHATITIIVMLGDKNVIIKQLLWCFFQVLKIMFIVEPCYRIQDEVDQVAIYLGQLICKMGTVNNPLLVDLKKVYKQLLFQTPLYTPMNICTLDRELITSIFAIVATCILTINTVGQY